MDPYLTLNDIKIPRFFYGTAWKEEQTQTLVENALNAGFRALDTANQRKHYYEEGVGKGLKNFLGNSSVSREEIFLQTKFTYARGQDHRKPYDENAPYSEQVKSSFLSSLEHLNTDYIDSYILHGPFYDTGISDEDIETWQSIEQLYKDGKVKLIGVSNFSSEQLEELCTKAQIKPTFVQNRCFARFKWDAQVRELCNKNQILYQGFSLLTANVQELSHPQVFDMAKHYNVTLPQLVFKFSQQLGMITLTGTTNKDHMSEDLKIHGFELTPNEVETLENIAFN